MIKLYGHEISGNVYKVRLLLALLQVDYEYIRVDLMAGEHKQPEYLQLNPFGQVPGCSVAFHNHRRNPSRCRTG